VSAFVLGDDETTAVLETLASEKAQAILSSLAEQPATASELADRVDTSLQNIHYHLTNLCEADLVDNAGTWYSSKGREMTVYAPTSESLELRIDSSDSRASRETSLQTSSDC
jgi:predicted ArsR family transcriptional regulator